MHNQGVFKKQELLLYTEFGSSSRGQHIVLGRSSSSSSPIVVPGGSTHRTKGHGSDFQRNTPPPSVSSGIPPNINAPLVFVPFCSDQPIVEITDCGDIFDCHVEADGRLTMSLRSALLLRRRLTQRSKSTAFSIRMIPILQVFSLTAASCVEVRRRTF